MGVCKMLLVYVIAAACALMSQGMMGTIATRNAELCEWGCRALMDFARSGLTCCRMTNCCTGLVDCTYCFYCIYCTLFG